jgi:predicted DCC family thiol-disulfide oxidoreductase YuxK
MRYDRWRLFYFISLQHPKAKEFFEQYLSLTPEKDTVVFFDRGSFYYKSNAVLKAFSYLNPPISHLKVFWILPRKLRDSIYDLIARNRFRWFGSHNQCQLPDHYDRNRILV